MKIRIVPTTTRRALLAAATLALATASHAALVVTFQQVGADVVETASGSANLAALTLGVPSSPTGTVVVSPNQPLWLVGPAAGANVSTYSGLTGPSNFGGNFLTAASSGTGQVFGISGGAPAFLFLPVGYVSNAALAGTSTFNGKTFASMGLVAGTYTWTWGSGATADSATLQIGPVAAAVPEPGSALAGMLALGACASGLFRRNRQGAVRG